MGHPAEYQNLHHLPPQLLAEKASVCRTVVAEAADAGDEAAAVAAAEHLTADAAVGIVEAAVRMDTGPPLQSSQLLSGTESSCNLTRQRLHTSSWLPIYVLELSSFLLHWCRRRSLGRCFRGVFPIDLK